MPENYYTLLHIARTASLEEVRRAYYQQVRLHHPDVNQQQNDLTIKRLNEAYTVLRDPTRRAAYDKQLRTSYRSSEEKMTWVQGMFGFVRELKKNMRD